MSMSILLLLLVLLLVVVVVKGSRAGATALDCRGLQNSAGLPLPRSSDKPMNKMFMAADTSLLNVRFDDALGASLSSIRLGSTLGTKH